LGEEKVVADHKFLTVGKTVKDLLIRKYSFKNAKFGAENLHFGEILREKSNAEH